MERKGGGNEGSGAKYEKRNPDEQILVSSLCVGVKTETFGTSYLFRPDIEELAVLQKINGRTGFSEGKCVVYAELDEEKYIYTRPDGSAFVPRHDMHKIAPLASFTEVKNYQEIVETCLEKLKNTPNLDENTLAAYQKDVDLLRAAYKRDIEPRFILGHAAKMSDDIIRQYIVAFGNPLDREVARNDDIVQQLAQSFAAVEEAAQAARRRFRIVKHDNEAPVEED
jgi:hypothetical protein